MKQRILAIAFVALMCIGALPLMAGTSDAEVVYAPEEGDEYRAVLNIDNIEDGLKGIIEGFDPSASEVLEEKGVNGYLQEKLDGILEDPELGDVLLFKNKEAVKLNHEIDLFGSYTNTVSKVTDESITIKESAALGLKVNARAEVTADFLKAGTYTGDETDPKYERRTVYMDVEFLFSIVADSETDHQTDGAVTGIRAKVEAEVLLKAATNLNVKFDEDGKITLAYDRVSYGAYAMIGIDATAKFTPGIMITPFVLDETDEDKNTKISMEKLRMYGEIRITDDLKGFIDRMKGEGFTDQNIMDLEIGPFEFKDGKLDLPANEDILEEMSSDLDYSIKVEDIDEQYRITFEIGEVSLEMLPTWGRDPKYVSVVGSILGTFIPPLAGDEGIFKGTDSDEQIAGIRARAERLIDPSMIYDKEGNNDLVLYAGIGISAVAIAGVAIFLLMRRS